jgi:predicted deacetylase
MYKLNISIDDVSPHTKSSIVPVLNFRDKFPRKKVTLFIPTAYWRTVKQGITTQYPLKLSEHEQFCQQLLDLPSDLFECAYHGYYHGIPFQSDNDEFKSLTYDEACNKFELMLDEVKRAGLESSKVT